MASTLNPSSSYSLDEYTQRYDDDSRKFSPTLAMVIILMLAGCCMLAFVSVVVRRCILERARAADALMHPQPSGNYPMKLTCGLEKADVDALPLVHGADLGEKDDHECPVCLAEFADQDSLRLLPACNHVFHQECIDAWFDSHSTCPLCRASLVGSQDSSSTVPAANPVHVHIHGEDEDSDAEVHGDARHGASSRRGFTGSRRWDGVSSREDSVRVRNAESEAGVAGADKESSFRKPSSLSADLVSLRNLLMGANQARVVTASEASFRSLKPELSLSHQDEWATIDLETGKAAEPASTSSSTSPPGPAAAAAPERSWSDRFSHSRIKGMAMLSRSISDVSSRHTPRLPL